MVAKYQNRISGSIFDRIDIHLAVPRMSIAIRTRVEAARQVQQARFAKLNKLNVLVNGDRPQPIVVDIEQGIAQLPGMCQNSAM
jgi:predicted ATPase with chaperone activity